MRTNETIPAGSRVLFVQHRAKAKRLLFCAVLCSVLGCSVVPVAWGQFQFERLKSFGFPERAGAFPTERLIEASDGKLYGTAQGAGTVFTLKRDGSGYSVLHVFAPDDAENGEVATRGVIEGRDGALYGTTSWGAVEGREGTVFRLNKDGTGYSVLRSFSGADGHQPTGFLLEGGAGELYGTTRYGGTNNGGTVFKLGADGSNYATLHSFGQTDGNPMQPEGLVEGTDGALYGITHYGGDGNYGTVFKLNKDGNGYTVLHHFFSSGGAGRHPVALIKASDGLLCGITYGQIGNRTVFKLNEDGSGYAELHNFTDAEGHPFTGLVEGSDGFLYGTTDWGGASGGGTVFRLNKDGSSFAVVREFASTETNGHGPAGLVEGSDRALYGVTEWGGASGGGTVFKLHKDGGGFEVLRHFFRTDGDGRVPSHLVMGTDGALYGTSIRGGTDNLGTFFKLNQDGSEHTVFRSFGPYANEDHQADGRFPLRLSEGSDGVLYGITEYGGSTNRGTVFKVHKDGSGYAVLHRFTVGYGDGRQLGGFVAGSGGVLYGTTLRGGSNDGGMVFKLNTDGSGYRELHSFAGGSDKWYAGASLIEGNDGALYGTKYSYANEGVSGIVFKLNKDGSTFVVLHSFDNTANEWPIGLVEGSNGILYGTTKHGGSQGQGTVFNLRKDGSGYEVLHSFMSAPGDGANPSADLVEGSDGTLYGTTQLGGSHDLGTVFSLHKDGTDYSVLRNFTGTTGDGARPGNLARGGDGSLHGITSSGGDMGFGTIFVLRPQAVMLPSIVFGGGMLVRFTSIPGSTHRLLRATTLDGSWLTLTNLVVPTNGVAEFTDPARPQPSGFYRTFTP